MIKSLTKTEMFKEIQKEAMQPFHAYLLTSNDEVLNTEVAKLFAYAILCSKNEPCFECENCKRLNFNKHPDVEIIDKKSIVVDDVNVLQEKMSLKPMISKYKIFIILGAERINEISQNKLLKSLEEPDEDVIFIFTTTKKNLLLNTVISRLKTINLKLDSLEKLKQELSNLKIKKELLFNDFSLTEMFKYSFNEDAIKAQETIENIFIVLEKSQDIVFVMNKLSVSNKQLFFEMTENLFLSLLNETMSVFSYSFVEKMKKEYPKQIIPSILKIINDSYKKYKSNVNFNYVLDQMLFEILKEKYLCK